VDLGASARAAALHRLSFAIVDFPQNPLACVRQQSDGCQCGRARRKRSNMKIFTIETETNNIIVHDTIQEAKAVTNAEPFRNEAVLLKLAADWPAARLVEIWNSLPGVSPVKKFKDRQTAVTRIWKALQCLGQVAPTADEQPPVAEAAPIQKANRRRTRRVRDCTRAL
jgi:hypothetical protein